MTKEEFTLMCAKMTFEEFVELVLKQKQDNKKSANQCR